MPFRRCLALALVVALPNALAAQGRVSGIVFDSIRAHAPLAGAMVQIEGVSSVGVTDERGRFRIADVPSGRHRATFFHPWLDTIRTAAPVFTFDVRDGLTTTLALATPSWRTLSTFLCKRPLDAGLSVVFGQARSAEGDRPLADAAARVEWFEWSIDASRGLEQGRRSLEVLADSAGEFTLCGVPNDVEITLRVSAGRQTTGPVDLDLDREPIAWRSVLVSLSDTASRIETALVESDSLAQRAEPAGSARAALTVLDEARRPLVGAIASLRGTTRSATTDAAGRAILSHVAAGTQTVVVRAIGSRPLTRPVDLCPGQTSAVEIVLPRAPPEIATVTVHGVRVSPEREAFERRRRTGAGYHFEGDKLRRHFRSTADLATIPALRVPLTANTSRELPRFRKAGGAYCTPAILVDGIALGSMMNGNDLTAMLRLAVRLEVYRGSSAPFELMAVNDCGVIAIWLR